MIGLKNGGNVVSSTTRNMGKLLVAGCSVSDYTQVDKVWGEYLSEKLGVEYIHEGAGCGSNWRIWRVIINAINTNQITPDDKIFVQYTEVTRKEFWSPFNYLKEPLYNSNHNSWINDTYPNLGDSDGVLIRYKVDAHIWHTEKKDRPLFKAYNKHVNPAYEKEIFLQQHAMFQCFLKQREFDNVYFITVGGYGTEMLDDQLNPIIERFYRNNWVHIRDAFEPPAHLPGDPGHLSDWGHEDLAKRLAKHFSLT